MLWTGPFLHFGVPGGAPALVSGDRDLLVLSKVFGRAGGCPSIGPAAFLRHHSFDRLVP